MWALNLTQAFEGYKNRFSRWEPAIYLADVWGFFEDLEDAPKNYSELLVGTVAELREILAIKYAVPESSACTRIGNGKDEDIYIPNHAGLVKGCYVSQYPVYQGSSWEEALEIVTRLPKILVKSTLVPEEYRPAGTSNHGPVFGGAYGCEYSKATYHVFLWHDPKRALRLLTNKAKREAGLIKPRKPSVDYYQLLMKCLRSVVAEHAEAFKRPRGLPHTLNFERLHVKIVAKRAQFKDDPAYAMGWIKGCHEMYRLLDQHALGRLGRTRRQRYYWRDPDRTYRQAIQTLMSNEAKMKDCVKRYFKITSQWRWFFGFIRSEEHRLTRHNTAQLKLAA